jgi:broad specificity phosphatase PhoE
MKLAMQDDPPADRPSPPLGIELPAKSATLILVRHGETEGQSSVRYFGRTNVPLSEFGRAQMRAVRDALRAALGPMPLGGAFASPLCRALEAARIIADGSMRIQVIEELTEIDFGLFEGLHADEIRRLYPREFARWDEARFDDDYVYPKGEGRREFIARVGHGVERLLELSGLAINGTANCSLLAAHRGVIRTVAKLLTGSEPVVELGSIQILERVADERWEARVLASPRISTVSSQPPADQAPTQRQVRAASH